MKRKPYYTARDNVWEHFRARTVADREVNEVDPIDCSALLRVGLELDGPGGAAEVVADHAVLERDIQHLRRSAS